MSVMMVSFCAVLFSRGVLDEILNLTESVSEGFPSYSSKFGRLEVGKVYTYTLNVFGCAQKYICGLVLRTSAKT